MTVEDRLYKSSEAAKLLGVALRTLYNYIKAGQIKATHRGGRVFIDGEEIKRFMRDGVERGYYIGLWGKKKDNEG